MPTFNEVFPTLLNPAASAPFPHSKPFCWCVASLNSRVSRAHCFRNPLPKASGLENLTMRCKPSHAVHNRRGHLKPGTQYTLKCVQWVEIPPHRWCCKVTRSLPNTRLQLMNFFVSRRLRFTLDIFWNLVGVFVAWLKILFNDNPNYSLYSPESMYLS